MSDDWTDAWILVSTIFATREKKSPGLEDILFAADAINKAIPTLEELNHAFSRLINLGLVERSGDSFRSTRAAQKLLVQAKRFSWRPSLFRQVELLAKKLSRVTGSKRQVRSEVTEDRSEVTQEQLSKAYDRYQAAFERLYQEIVAGDPASN